MAKKKSEKSNAAPAQEPAQQSSAELQHIAPALRGLAVPLDSLSPDPANARRHPDRNLQSIMGSLKRFGQQRPIVVDGKGVVRAGNGTLEAAKALGWRHVAATTSDLKGSELTAFAIADNRTAEHASWDFEVLAEQLGALKEEGVELQDLGWAEHEVEPMLAADWSPPAQNTDGDLPPEHNAANARPIAVTPAQREVIERAIAEIRKNEGEGITEGRCLELICADWMGGK